MNIGATGEHPYGKLCDDDQGEIMIAITGDRQTETVFVDFGHPVTWIGMRPEQAEAMAVRLRVAARRARRGGPDIDQIALEWAREITDIMLRREIEGGTSEQMQAKVQVRARQLMEAWGGKGV